VIHVTPARSVPTCRSSVVDRHRDNPRAANGPISHPPRHASRPIRRRTTARGFEIGRKITAGRNTRRSKRTPCAIEVRVLRRDARGNVTAARRSSANTGKVCFSAGSVSRNFGSGRYFLETVRASVEPPTSTADASMPKVRDRRLLDHFEIPFEGTFAASAARSSKVTWRMQREFIFLGRHQGSAVCLRPAGRARVPRTICCAQLIHGTSSRDSDLVNGLWIDSPPDASAHLTVRATLDRVLHHGSGHEPVP